MDRSALRTAIREAANMANSLFVTDTEIDRMIDLSVADLFDILAKQYGDEYWAKTWWIQVRAGSDTAIAWPRFEPTPESPITAPDLGYPSCYALPNDFMRLVRCQFFRGTVSRQSVQVGTLVSHTAQSTQNWTLSCADKRAYPMHRIDTPGQLIDFEPRDWMQTRVAYRLRHGPISALSYLGLDGSTPVYTLVTNSDSVIDFLPVPNASYAVQVTYVPTPALHPTNHPFQDYLLYDCAAQCKEKEESDSSTLRALQQRVIDRIERYARTPDAAQAPKVADVYGRNRIPSSGDPWDLP